MSFLLFYVKEVCHVQGNVKNHWLVNGSQPRRLPLTPTMNTTRASYTGLSRKLVVALDIGTTYSGAAYALLDPGKVPQIKSVTRQVSTLYPGLAANSGERINER